MLYKNYIGGEWVDAKGGGTFQSVNPATGAVLGDVALSGPEDVNAAAEAAASAFDAWRKTPAPKRGEILFRAGEILVRRKEELARLMTQEMGKVLKETRGDVQEAIDMTYYMAGEGRRLFGQTTPSELPNKFAMSLRDPIGVVAAITPWNFPLAIPTWKIMPALIAGNTVVLKPASDTPILAWQLASILEEAGLPPGALNVVFGPGGQAGQALVESPKVALVSFTGSTAVGRELGATASARGKRVSLEMGGKNAILVMADADLELAVEGIIWSAFGTTGQRCTAASRVIAQRGIAEELTQMIVARAEKLRLGDGLRADTDMGPLINEAARRKVHAYVQVGQQEGARLRAGGETAETGELRRGFFYKPTVFAEVRPEARLAQEEIFGPVVAVIPVDNLQEAIAVNNATGYGLSSSLYTRDVNQAFQAIRDITTGLVYINAGTIGAEVHLPFGGTRGTGNGHREAGQSALDIFSEWKTVFVDYSGRLQRAQIDVEEQKSQP